MLTTTLHLADDELLSLTHLRRPSAQARALQVMGVPYRTRPDGTKVVTSRYAVRKLIHNAVGKPTPD